MKGKLIVIDGTDGSGKETQTSILKQKLEGEGFDVETVAFPRYREKSAFLVEEYLKGKFGNAKEVGPYRASIFYAVDRYVSSFDIKKWLDEGKIVISDRYVSASIGHQAGKIGDKEERDKFIAWLEDLEFNIFKIPKPDLVFFLNMLPEKGQELSEKKWQGSKRDIHEKDIEHLKDAYEVFLDVAKKEAWSIIECVQDNELRNKEDISEEIFEKVKSLI